MTTEHGTNTTHQERMNLAKLALDGISVGDAFGERFFTSPATVESLIAQRAFPKQPWRWTDDTAMALSIVEVLSAHETIQRDELAKAFATRYWAEPDRGYGGGAHRILQSINEGLSWRDAAATVFQGQGSYGNGGAMRSGPIGAYFWDDYELVVANAGASAEPTHAHPEGRAGAIAVAIAVAVATRMARGDMDRDGRTFIEQVLRFCPAGITNERIGKVLTLPLSYDVRTVVAAVGNGSEISAQDTVPLCIWCAARHLDDFEEAMWTTVSALGDRDTTCAIVGGIVALSVGRAGIPDRFLAAREPLPATDA